MSTMSKLSVSCELVEERLERDLAGSNIPVLIKLLIIKTRLAFYSPVARPLTFTSLAM